MRHAGPWFDGMHGRRKSLCENRKRETSTAKGAGILAWFMSWPFDPAAGKFSDELKPRPQRFPRSRRDSKAARKKKRLPRGTGAADCAAGYECCYWVGRTSCENPMVLTERNDGVRGGRHAGPRVKLVSKV
jgi:hypothetical protein